MLPAGPTRFARLIHIGTHCQPLSIEALKTAVAESKSGRNVNDYKEAWDCIRQLGPEEPEAIRDEVWIETTEAANKAETARLEAELKVYRNNLIRESIRVSDTVALGIASLIQR